MSLKGLNLPKEITKFLAYSDNAKYLRYMFGGFGIYIEEVTPLYPVKENRGQFQRPTLLTAKFDKEEQIGLLLAKADPRLQVRRVFKSGWVREKNKDKIDGFTRNCVKNVLHLGEGKTFRVTSKDNPELQKRFYDIFVEMNKEEKTECKFDYDEFDVTFWIKTYRVPAPLAVSDKLWIVTSVEGLPVA